jgi:hypothetical protein
VAAGAGVDDADADAGHGLMATYARVKQAHCSGYLVAWKHLRSTRLLRPWISKPGEFVVTDIKYTYDFKCRL